MMCFNDHGIQGVYMQAFGADLSTTVATKYKLLIAIFTIGVI